MNFILFINLFRNGRSEFNENNRIKIYIPGGVFLCSIGNKMWLFYIGDNFKLKLLMKILLGSSFIWFYHEITIKLILIVVK